MRYKKMLVGLAGLVAALGVGGGVAVAVWSVSGSGSGAGAAAVSDPLVVTPVTPAGAGASLTPGGPAGPVFMNIQNPNAFAVTVTGLSWGTPTSTSTSSCPSANITLDAGAPTTASVSIAAGATASDVQINGVLDLAHTAPSGCQGVAFDIPLTATGTQQ